MCQDCIPAPNGAVSIVYILIHKSEHGGRLLSMIPSKKMVQMNGTSNDDDVDERGQNKLPTFPSTFSKLRV